MSELPAVTAARLRIPAEDIRDFEVRRKSVDSRKKPYIQFVYTVDFSVDKKLRIPKKLSQDIHGLQREWAERLLLLPERGHGEAREDAEVF